MRILAVATLLGTLVACGPGPYDYATLTGWPVEPPPGSNGAEDQEASLPYDRSPWFDEDELTADPGRAP